MKTNKLLELREAIDHLDKEIVNLLVQRFQVTEEVGRYKAENQLTAQDETRESEKFARIAQLAKQNGGNPDQLVKIYRLIMDLVIARHKEHTKPGSSEALSSQEGYRGELKDSAQ